MQYKIFGNKISIKQESEFLVVQVKQKYIQRLITYYGFSPDQMLQDVFFENKNIKSNICADIVIWNSVEAKENKATPLIVVECKAEQVTIRPEDYYKGSEFASSIGAKFFVTTNLKQTRIFSKIYRVNKKEQDLSLIEIINIPNVDEAIDERQVSNILGQTIELNRDEFSRLLFKCHSIIRNNDKLSPEAAFDEISKILFIKTLKERQNSKDQIFGEKEYLEEKSSYDTNKGIEDLPFYQKLFDNIKRELKNDDLFELSEKIRIRENSFEDIIKELQGYNLSTTGEDVKGIAFEEFLGRTFRGELGQFFTPRTVVDFMVKILDPVEGETICDPCCGSGGFLIRAFEYVKTKLENDIQKKKIEIKNKYYSKEYFKQGKKEQNEKEDIVNKLFNLLNTELDVNFQNSRLRKLSYDCIYGTDANPRMARTAKMNMIMHGDGHGGVHHHDGLINVNGVYEERFDVILTNPPFGARVEKNLRITSNDIPSEEKIKEYVRRYGNDYTEKVISPLREWANFDNGKNKPIGKTILSLFETGKFSGLTETLFIERCINLLKPGGRMGIVLPDGVLNNTNLQKVREFIEGKAKIILITSIPQDVFIASGATVKPSLMFFKKFTNEEAQLWNYISVQAKKEIELKYAQAKEDIKKALYLKGSKAISQEKRKEILDKQKELNDKIKVEINGKIRHQFDYQILVSEIKKAGISSTGAKIENELEPLENEFTNYRKMNILWEEHMNKYEYLYLKDEFFRKCILKNSIEETLIELKKV